MTRRGGEEERREGVRWREDGEWSYLLEDKGKSGVRRDVMGKEEL